MYFESIFFFSHMGVSPLTKDRFYGRWSHPYMGGKKYTPEVHNNNL